MGRQEIFTVPETEQGSRLDLFLALRLAAYSRARVQHAIAEGRVFVNNSVTDRANYRVETNDEISFTHTSDNPFFPTPDPKRLEILYEDDYLLVVNKPTDMATHPNGFNEKGTLAQAVLAYFPPITKAIYDPENPVSRLRPGIVHRLDRDTSGVILIAKTRPTLIALAQQFHNRSIQKEYSAILYGNLQEAQHVTLPLQRLPGDQNRMGITTEGGRAADTEIIPDSHYLYQEDYLTLVTCRPHTGRTHQIRVHAAAIGHSVMGDKLYALPAAHTLAEELKITHQLLHSRSLTFIHPITGRTQTVSAPTPERFLNLLTGLRQTW